MLKQTIIVIVAIFIIITTTYIPQNVPNNAGLKEVTFGYPLGFVSQDFSKFANAEENSHQVTFSDKMMTESNNLKVNFISFSVNVAILVLLFELFKIFFIDKI